MFKYFLAVVFVIMTLIFLQQIEYNKLLISIPWYYGAPIVIAFIMLINTIIDFLLGES